MGGTSVSVVRRMSDPAFMRQYFVGHGLDIGGKRDPLTNYADFYPLIKSVRVWDWDDGDAQLMKDVPDNSFDFVYSSHCLEHLADPRQGFINWYRILKPGGHLIMAVPDEDMYEQGTFPSTYNNDHKWTFTVMKEKSWSTRSINILSLFQLLGETCDVQRIQRLDSTYWYNIARFDQTLTNFAECGIEFVIRKRPQEELARGGRLPPQQPSEEQFAKAEALLVSRLNPDAQQ